MFRRTCTDIHATAFVCIYTYEKSNSASCSVALQPHGLCPARLLCPWNSPGKNTAVGSHSLLQGNLPYWGIKPRTPALQADFLPSEPPGKPIYFVGLCTHLHIYTHTKHIDFYGSESSLAFRVHVRLLNCCCYIDGIHIVVCVAS